jgi:hypothetical protein
MTRFLLFLGGFGWMISAFLALIGMFYLKELIPEITKDHFEIFIGFIGANVLAFIIAFKQFSSGSYSYSMDSEDDPLISAVSGIALAGLICLIVWLYLSETPIIVLTVGVISSLLAFFGIIFVGRYWHSESSI